MKLYYDCKIKAAYMSKYFAVHFKSGLGQSLYFDGGSDFRTEKDCGIYMGEKFYINPNSLHIFNPIERDFVYFKTLKKIFMISFEPTGYPSELSKESANGKFRNELTIIQRNNLPFIMPEKGE